MVATSPSRRNQHLIIASILLLWTTAVFFPVMHYGFVNHDDGGYVYANPYTVQGLTLKGITSAFTQEHVGSWFPLSLVSHMLDVEMFGLNAGAHHLVNLGFHLCNTILLYVALAWMTRAPYLSGMVAALFALHPLHVEPVVWVSSRKDVLSTFFMLLTVLAYRRYVEHRQLLWYVLMACCYILGMLAKSMLMTVPVLLLLLDFWPLGRLNNRRQLIQSILEKAPLVAIALGIVSIAITIMPAEVFSSLEKLPIQIRLMNSITSYVIYLGKTFSPRNLAAYYPYPVDTWNLWPFIGAVFVLLGITAYAVIEIRRRPYVFVGWLWFVVTLVPVIGIVHYAKHLMADHYTYIPLIGLFIAVVWLVGDVAQQSKQLARGMVLAGIVVIASFSLLSVRYVQLWKDDVALYAHTLEVSGPSPVTLKLLGAALLRQGKPEKAVKYYEASLRLAPHQAFVLNDLGAAYASLNQLQEAEIKLTEALKLNPDLREAQVNLAKVRQLLAKRDQEIAVWEKAVHQDPENVSAYIELAARYGSVGRAEDAVMAYRRALELEPSNTTVHVNLGNLLVRLNRFAEAIEHYNAYLAVNPEDTLVLYNLAAAFAKIGKLSEATEHLRLALVIRPNFAQAQRFLAELNEETWASGQH